MDYKYFLGIAATVLALINYIPYFRNILRGKTKPHAFSWLGWTILTFMAFYAQITQGGGSGAWVTGFTALICLFVFILALKKGEKKIVPFDWFCLLSAGLILVFYILTRDPLISVVLITIVDAVVFIPTVRKSYHRPYEETLSLYATNTFKFLLSLIALQSYSLVTVLYPAAWLVMNGLFSIALYLRRKKVAPVIFNG